MKAEIYFSDSKSGLDITLPGNAHIKYNPGYFWELHAPGWELENLQELMRYHGKSFYYMGNRYEWQIKRVNGPFRTKDQALHDIKYKFSLIGRQLPDIS